MDVVGRICLAVSAVSGIALSWVLYDWIGRYEGHCDFPNPCVDTWLPKAFEASQYLWVGTVFAAGVAVVVACLSRWPRRDVYIISLAWAALFWALAITPMHGGGAAMSQMQAQENYFFYARFRWYQLFALVTLASSLVLATQAVRGKHVAPLESGWSER